MDTQTIYVGPTISKFGLIRNQVFLDGLPGHIKALIEEQPLVEQLIVPLEELSTALNDVQAKGTHLHHVAQVLREKAGER